MSAPHSTPFNAITRLINPATVRALRGLDAKSVRDMAEGQSLFGALNWVWNVAVRADGHSERRFWITEVIAPEDVKGLELPAVLEKILGSRVRFRAGEVGQLLMVDDRHIFNLHRANQLAGDVIGHTRWITRASLQTFLTDRLILK